MKIKAFSQEGGGILWVISGIALASCGGGGGGGSSSGGRVRTPVTRPPVTTPVTTPTPDPNPDPNPITPPDPNPNNSPIILRDTNRNEVGSYTVSVDEDAAGGTTVVTISASVDDAPSGHVITYQFVNSGSVSNFDGAFGINTSSGAIRVDIPRMLDYETATSHTLTVRVTYDADGDGINTTTDQITRDVQVVIDVNDVEGIRLRETNGDVVDSYTGSIDEDGGNADLPTISASVDDAPSGHVITYQFVNSGSVSNFDGAFGINTSSGAIRVDIPRMLDYETATSHTLTVRVTYDADGDGINTTTDQITRDVQVVINVNDVAGQSPAIIPDRQSFAHQDSYDPDDLGLTPMPDADPSAG